MTWWKIAIPLLTILVLALINFHTDNFTAADGFNPGGLKAILLAVSTGGIIFSYLGLRAGRPAGRRVEEPAPRHTAGRSSARSRSAPSSTSLLQIVFLVALPGRLHREDLGRGGRRALHRSSPVPSPRSRRSRASAGWPRSSSPTRSSAPAGTGVIYTTGSSRVAYGLSRNGYIPSMFEWTNERRVPWVGLIAAFITGCICFLPFPSWQSLVGLITSASVLMYAGAPLSLGAFRKRLPDADRPFRLPMAEVLCPLAFAISGLMILWTDLGHRLEARCGDPHRLRDPRGQPASSTSTSTSRCSTGGRPPGCRRTCSAWA